MGATTQTIRWCAKFTGVPVREVARSREIASRLRAFCDENTRRAQVPGGTKVGVPKWQGGPRLAFSAGPGGAEHPDLEKSTIDRGGA